MRATAKEPKSKFATYFRKHKLLYLMAVPMVAYFLLFNYYPMLGLQLAFKDWNPWEGIWGSPFASTEGTLDIFKHFKNLFADPLFWQKFGNTLRISVLKTLFGFPLPILVAVLLNEMKSTIFKKTVQTVSYLPHFISWVIISGILLTMTAADSPLQKAIETVFGRQIFFFNQDGAFVFMLVLSEVWKTVGWGTIIYLAALAGVPNEQYEAAEIDGAGRWAKMRFITLPAIMPAVGIKLIFELSGLTSAGFDQVFNMYNSTVYGMGDILETYLYRRGIIGGNYDVATALGLFNSLIALALTLAANKTVNKLGGEGIW